MSRYCKAYHSSSLQLFTQWHLTPEMSATPEELDPIYYLWDDFVVRKSPVRRDTVLFEAVTPAWQKFCAEQLQFVMPREIRSALASAQPAEVSSSPPKEYIPFTSGQHWLLDELNAIHPYYQNVVVAFPLPLPLSITDFERMLHHLVHHHDAFRLHMERIDATWHQWIPATDDPLPLMWVSAAHLANDEQKSVFHYVALEMQREINSLQGYLWYATFCETKAQKVSILFAVNHFITDGMSHEILLRDWSTLYQQTLQGKGRGQQDGGGQQEGGGQLRPYGLPPQTTSFKEWAWRITEYLQSPVAQKEIQEYWLALPWQKIKPLPLDFPEGKAFDPQTLTTSFGTRSSTRTISVDLGREDTQALLRKVANRHTQPQDLFLTALALTFTARCHSPVFSVFIEDHARVTQFADIDLLRTVGYIAHSRRLLLDLSSVSSPLEALEAIRRQLRQAPNNGRTLDWLLHCAADEEIPEALKHITRADLHLNLLGGVNSMSTAARTNGSQIPLVDYPQALRNHALNCDITMAQDNIRLVWEYSCDLHRATTVEKLIQEVLATLRQLITGVLQER